MRLLLHLERHLSRWVLVTFATVRIAYLSLACLPGRIDILQGMEGVSFDEAWGDHVDMQIDETVTAHYVSVKHLIRNKELVGRPSDLADVDELRRIRGLK
jgi:hypothetical protein